MKDLKLSQAFKALSNPNRLRLYTEILQRHDEGVTAEPGCALAELLPILKIGAPTVSHHIKELVNSDLIRVERHGKFMVCHINEVTRKALQAFLRGTDPE